MNAFVLSRNRYATGYLALTLGAWHFSTKAHVDLKRVYSRFGFCVYDSTTRAMLDSLTGSSMAKLKEDVARGIAVGEVRYQIILDNVQQYCIKHERGLLHEDELIVGTAATAVRLDDCAPNAFDLKDHLDRVVKKERITLTAQTLYNDIDWKHIHKVQAHHWTRVLVNFIPSLAPLIPDLNTCFRGDTMAKHRMREGRKTVIQPLGTNSERETETQGMLRAVLDFEKQMGLDADAMDDLLFMVRGDGASIAAIGRIKKYLSAHPDDYKAFRNRIPPGPEIWHTRATDLNSMAANHYGPRSSRDPSALSRSANAANVKRPANLKKCDFYPTSRSITLFFEARVLDCFR
jgi:uncharacterized protein YerC